ncbi:transcriptional regulator [Breoghania corrubedonensis]|uniref:Transcriptional regulator n=1 Tax=Breoghania corrubedonensis TaxID=665038 RepID=A0A2T5V7W2_9HYPH|nr:LysR family transcriptional regulator [Breoghania corrubedonensis]PTW59847.1 transcriptional regulator [Breoghania corrubedonensis]
MIDKLEMFIALAKQKHFGHAAEECRVTQPTLSAAIKQLEDFLGVKLVRRGSRFQGLTPEGMRVLDWARRIVSDARAMQEEMHAARHGLTGDVRIAVIPTALTMVKDLTAPFCERHPDIRFTILARSSIEILSLVVDLKVDVGITYLDNEPLGKMTSVPLYSEHYHFVTMEGGPFAERKSVTWKEASSVPLCLLTQDMQNRRIIDKHLEDAGVTAAPTLESDSIIALFSHIRSGRWSGIMPSKLVEAFAPLPSLRSLPIDAPDVAHTVGIIANFREPYTPVIAALLQQAKAISAFDPAHR